MLLRNPNNVEASLKRSAKIDTAEAARESHRERVAGSRQTRLMQPKHTPRQDPLRTVEFDESAHLEEQQTVLPGVAEQGWVLTAQ